MSFVYVKVSTQKNLSINKILAMVIVYIKMSTQNFCIETVRSAVCICQIFRKKALYI